MSSDESPPGDADIKKRSFLRILLIDGSFLILFILTGIVAWLATGVRDVSFLREYVAGQIEREAPGIDVTFGALNAGIFVDSNALVIDVDELRLRSDSGMKLLLPKARLRLNSLKLLLGRVHLKELEIFSPVLAVRRGDDGTLALQVATDEKKLTSSGTNGPADVGQILASPFLGIADALRLHDLRLFISGDDKQTVLRVPMLLASFQRHAEPKVINLNASFIEGEGKAAENKGSFSSEVKFDAATGEIRGKLSAKGFDAGALEMLHPSLALLSGLALPVEVEAEFSRRDKTTPFIAKLTVDGKGGTFTSQEFPQAIPLDAVHIEAAAQDGLRTVAIKDLSLRTGTVSLTGKGALTLFEAGPGGEFEVVAENMQVDDLAHYWPLRLAPQSRAWVTERVKGGHVPHAEAKIHFTPEDFQAENLPQSFIDATVEVKGASVVYMPKMPQVTAIDATAHFTGTTMDVDVHAGKTMKNTVIKKADVDILDFNDIVTPAKIHVTADTTAEDALTAIDKERLDIGRELNLDPKTARGAGQLTIDLDFPLYPEDGGLKGDLFDHMNYVVKADLKGAGLNNVRGKWNVSNMDGTFSADNKLIVIKGNGGLQGQPVMLGVNYDQPKRSVEYAVKGQLPTDRLTDFGVSIPGTFTYSGTIGADVVMKEQGGSESVSATLDLKSAEVGMPDLNWKKPTGDAGNLFLKYQSLPTGSSLPEFNFTSKDLSARGSATLTSGKDLATLELSQFKYLRNDFSLSYKKENGIQTVGIRGDTLDLSPLQDPGKPSKNPFTFFEKLNLRADIKHVSVGKGSDLQNVRGRISCPADFCISGEINGNTESGKPFSYRLTQTGGERKVSVQSDDAGQVLSAFDISDHMKGGKLDLKGTFIDNKPNRPLDGRVMITDFAVVKGPVMTKLLSLASLTGFLDLLQGKGISFKKLSANFVLDGDTISVGKGKAYGSALGIMAEGDINPFNHGQLNMKGTVVPSYTANSLLGKIPLLGEALVGGKGEGLIAARFSVKGTSEDPSVSVNPLSLLTPGFLRNMFDVFDSPKSTRETPAGPQDGKSDPSSQAPQENTTVNAVPSRRDRKKRN